MKIEVEITKEEIEFLKQLKNYFGEHDKIMFEHKAYPMLDNLVKKLNEPAVINNEAEASSDGVAVCCDTCKYVNGFRCNHVQGCESNGNYELWEQKTGL